MNAKPKISLIICTYERYELVINALRVLKNQKLNRSNYEVIIIDNNPLNKRIEYKWQELGADRCVHEPEAGLSRARNKGIKEAIGDIIVFIDDDAEANENLLSNYISLFNEYKNAMAIGGKILPKYEQEKPQWITKKIEEYLSCIDWGDGTYPLTAGQWIAGANMGFRREVFEKFGNFSTSLGRIGSISLLSNEESELLERLPANSVYYSSSPLVDHLIPSSRLKKEWFRKRAGWQAISDLVSNKIDMHAGHYFFDETASQLPYVPAEYRNLKCLCYETDNGEEFERQLKKIYNLTVAMGCGLGSVR